MDKIKWCNVLVPIGGIVLLFTLLKPCQGEEVMKCNYSVYAAVLLFAVIAVENLLSLLLKEGKFITPLQSVLLSVLNILIPSGIIGGCMMPGMACRAKSFPGIYVCSAIIIILGAAELLLQFQQQRKRGNGYER